MKGSAELSWQRTYYMLITFKICGQTLPVNQNLHIQQIFKDNQLEEKRVLVYFSLQLNGELALAYNNDAGKNYYYDAYHLFCLAPYLIILEVATMNPLE